MPARSHPLVVPPDMRRTDSCVRAVRPRTGAARGPEVRGRTSDENTGEQRMSGDGSCMVGAEQARSVDRTRQRGGR
jgi:hypothetical protein